MTRMASGSHELTTGERIRRFRTRAGMSRAVLGGLVGRSAEWVKVSSPAFFGPGPYWSYATSWLFNQAS